MNSDDSKTSVSEQASSGKKSPNVVAGGNVNIRYGNIKPDVEGTEASLSESNKSQRSTALMVAGIGAAAALLAALIGLATTFIGDSEPAKSSIEISGTVSNPRDVTQVIATGDVDITGVPQSVVDRLLRTLDEKDVALEKRESQFEALLKKYKELEQRLAARDDTVSKRARDLLNAGALEEAEAVLKASLAARLENLQEQRELAAVEAFELGGIQELKLDYASTRDYYQQAVDLDPDNSTYLNDLGLIAHRLGQHQDAIDQFEKALSIDRKVSGKRHPNVARDLNNLGEVSIALGDYKKAIGVFERALSIDREVSGEHHPDVAIRLNNLGEAWRALGKYNKAIGLFEQALSIDREVSGERHPDVAIDMSNLGAAWDSLGAYQKAIGLYERALSIDREVSGERHPDVAIRLNNLGAAWKSLGEYNKAIRLFEQALSIDREVYGKRHLNVARDLNNLGVAWSSLGEYKKAIGLYEQALSIDREVYGKRHPDVAIDLSNLGAAWNSLDEYKKAIGLYEQALAILSEALGLDHPDSETVAQNLASLRQQVSSEASQ